MSIVLSIAYYLTLAKFFLFLFIPWLLYVAIWLVVVTASYGIGFWRALLLAVALSVLSWLATAISGVPTFRAG